MNAPMKSNAPITERVIPMACGVVRLLKEKVQEIRNFIDVCVSAPVEVCFQPSGGFIVIKGLPNDVDVTADILGAQDVFCDTVETNEPGLRKEMLTEPIKLLERMHQCAIEAEEVSRPNVAAPINNSHHQQSSSELASSDSGRIDIKVVCGSITEFKADVLVNTIGDKSLERGGVVLRQFLEAGFPHLEQELRKLKIPEVFGRDVVVTRAFGSINAKYVLHAAIEKYQEDSSLDKLYDTIKICLQMAVNRNATRIAFPTLGCGRLAFDPEDVVECFFRAERDVKTNLKIRIVAYDEDLHKQFRELIRHEAKRNPREVKVTEHRRSLTGLMSIQTRVTNIKVVSGNITKFKADVLVNTIADKNLEMGGVVLRQFLEAGSPNLEQELRKLKIPEVFGRDVVVTRAFGSINAKYVLHAAIEKYQEKTSLGKLYNTIKTCLEMAMDKNATSIAFPTLGCGKLAFEPEDVVKCFFLAERDSKTNLKIFIIAFEEDVRKLFESQLDDLTCQESKQNQRDAAPTQTGSLVGLNEKMKRLTCRETPRPIESNLILLSIYALTVEKLKQTKEDLIKKMKDMFGEESIQDDVIALLDEEQLTSIEGFGNSNVYVEIDQNKKTVLLRGEKSSVREVKIKISEHLARISGARCYPVYWTTRKSSSEAASQPQLDSSSALYDEVSQMVMKTWDQQKVGQGFDAKGLGNHAIKITRIFCNENPLLMDQYTNLREIMSKSAKQYHDHRLADQNSEAEISTMALGPKKLYGTLNHQLNEVFLFHGTKSDAVTIIGAQGIDTRLCGEKPLFGSGSYFTESSTKADQYADPKEQRTSLGQRLYMYLCRVLLGSTYVCSDPKNVQGFKRPPCMERGCHSQKCLHLESYDSVVGTHRPNPQANGRLFFREFVVYHPQQSYPDFLIEYQRVAYP